MLAIRTGVVLLGPAACGKSSIVRTLQVGCFEKLRGSWKEA